MKYVNAGGRLAVLDGEDLVFVDGVVAADAGATGPLAALIELAAEDAEGTNAAVARGAARGERVPFEAADVRAPLPRPGKLIAAPVNYLDHQEEMNAEHTVRALGIFLKATSSVIGHRGTVILPYTDMRIDQEGELAVVIGRQARHVSASDAHEYVFGYTCGIDVSLRSTEDRSTRKSFDTFTPLGPAIVTADEIHDDADLRLTCRVNGVERQSTSTGDLIFGVADLIAYASSIMTLWPGDVILTGTPAGVGPIAPGDRIDVSITGLGTLTATVADDETSTPYEERPGFSDRS